MMGVEIDGMTGLVAISLDPRVSLYTASTLCSDAGVSSVEGLSTWCGGLDEIEAKNVINIIFNKYYFKQMQI